jgi:hypothetical protein
MFEFFFYFYFFSAVIFIGGTLLFVFFWRKNERDKVFRSLNFVLYEITLPHEKPKEDGKSFKELVAVMEQFYSGMVSGESYYALEIGLPAKGQELVFYAAVEKSQNQLFEKLVNGLFPFAGVSVKKDDYNIFKPDGFSAGCFAKLNREDVLPIRTYDRFESDPLQVVINTFSKLQKDGEGAALQIILSPSNERIIKKAKMVVSEVRKGESMSEALRGYESFWRSMLGELWNFIFGFGKDARKNELGQKSVDEELVKLLESKASRQMMQANIRLLASSTSKERANSILSELKSAFLQFKEAQGNGFEFIVPRGRKLKSLFYKFSFRLPDAKNALQLNAAELATIFHFPLGIVSSSAPKLKYLKTKEAPPPLNLSESGLLLGKNIYRGEISDVYIKDDDRRRHLYAIGQTGTGKSVLLKNMIVQDIEAGKGICFIDPHGSDIQDILSRVPPFRAEDVIYFDPGNIERPMGLNMLEYDPSHPEQKTFIVNELLGIFNKLFDMKTAGGPMFEQYFRNSVMLVMDDVSSGNSLLDVERVLSDKNFRDKKLSLCTNPLVKNFWRDVAEKAGGEASLQNMVPYITSKFDNFLSNEIMRPIIIQEKSAFNFRQAMDEGKILLINLSKGRLGDLNANLLGLIIVGKILMASLSRVDMPEEKRRDFYLYIDEFHNVTTDSIATILSEARKYKLNLTIAHQFIGQLEENIKKAIFGNVGSIVAFRVGAEDAEVLQKQFEPVFNSYDLINIDNYNACLKVLIDGQTSRPFSMQTSPFQKGDIVDGEEIAKLSSLKYGRPRAGIEAELHQRYSV